MPIYKDRPNNKETKKIKRQSFKPRTPVVTCILTRVSEETGRSTGLFLFIYLQTF